MLERSAKTELERKRKRRNARDYWLRDGDAAQTSTIIHPADVLLGSFATDPFSASGGQCLLCQADIEWENSNRRRFCRQPDLAEHLFSGLILNLWDVLSQRSVTSLGEALPTGVGG
jgi:hypothetical protein